MGDIDQFDRSCNDVRAIGIYSSTAQLIIINCFANAGLKPVEIWEMLTAQFVVKPCHRIEFLLDARNLRKDINKLTVQIGFKSSTDYVFNELFCLTNKPVCRKIMQCQTVWSFLLVFISDKNNEAEPDYVRRMSTNLAVQENPKYVR